MSILVVFSASWMFLRSNAISKPLKPAFAHEFNEIHRVGRPALFLQFQTAASDQTSALTTLSELANQAHASAGAGLWLDVRLVRTGELVVSSSDQLRNGKPVELASLDECRAQGLFTLNEAAPLLKESFVALNLIARRPGLPAKLFEIWGEGKPLPLDRTLVQSESEGILKELREQVPKAFFGSSQATLIQLEMLSTLGLQGLSDLKADALVSLIEEPTKRGGAASMMPRLRDSTLAEAHRRGLKRYVGPVRTREAATQLQATGYDGIILTERGIWEDLLDERRSLQ